MQTKAGDRKSKAQSARLIAEPRSHFAALFGVSDKYVRIARDLVKDDPPAVLAVRNGKDLPEAHHEIYTLARLRP